MSKQFEQANSPQNEEQFTIQIIEQHVKALGVAAGKSRITIIILVTASILAIICAMNSRPSSWFAKRISSVKNAIKYFEFPDERNNELIKTDFEQQLYKELERIVIRDEVDSTVISELPLGVSLKAPIGLVQSEHEAQKFFQEIERNKDEIIKTAQFIAFFNESSKKNLEERLGKLEEQKLENIVFVKLPFFGISFDVNDLAILSGLSFTIILLLLRFSLNRELTNIKNITGYIQDYEKKYKRDIWRYYHSLMGNELVFMLPKTRGFSDSYEVVSNREIWNFIPKTLLLLPIISYGLVIKNDLSSLEIGMAIDAYNTIQSLTFSGIFLLLMLLLANNCRLIWNQIEKAWNWREDETAINKAVDFLKKNSIQGKLTTGGTKYDIETIVGKIDKDKVQRATELVIRNTNLENLNFLMGFPNLKKLQINSLTFDLFTLRKLKHLEKIIIHGLEKVEIDRKYFGKKSLKDLMTQFNETKDKKVLTYLLGVLQKELMNCDINYHFDSKHILPMTASGLNGKLNGHNGHKKMIKSAQPL